MKWVIGILVILLSVLVVSSGIVWMNRTALAARYLSRHMGGVPSQIRSLEFLSKTRLHIGGLWLGNPPRSKTSTSFAVENTNVISTLDQVLGNSLVIDEIKMQGIFVGIEYYANGQTNWDEMLQDQTGATTKKDYLIRTLILENLTVEVVQANGTRKRYPTIQKMEFHNISSASGFPIGEIEKAIFHLMLQDLMKKLNLDQLLKQLPGGGSSPWQSLPGLFK